VHHLIKILHLLSMLWLIDAKYYPPKYTPYLYW
jgi:hypothetical protein